MAEPKVRFKRDDGSSYSTWGQGRLGDLIESFDERVTANCTLPVLTSSKAAGIQYQSEHFGRDQLHDITGYNVIPRGYCTYRNRSDGMDFTFNINNLCDRGIVSKFYPVFKAKDNCNLYFLMALLNSEPKTVRKIAMTAKGTGQKVLSFLDLQNIEINMPSIEEQQKIAAFLSSVDEVIAASEEEVMNLETQKKAVMKKVFSQEVRFKRTDETEFPEWEEKQMGEVINLLSGQDFPPEQYNDEGFGTPYLTGASCILNNKTTAVRWTKTPKNIVKFGDILIVCKGSGSGTVAIVDQQEAHIARQFMCIRPINQLDSKYCYHQVCEMTEDIRSEARGTIPGIDRKTVLQRTISIPCLEEQRLIADFLSDFDEVIAAAKRELELWKELKKGLLQQMFI